MPDQPLSALSGSVPSPEGDCPHCDGIVTHVGACPVDPVPPDPPSAQSEPDAVRLLADRLDRGDDPWAPDGPQSLTEWDECAAAWRALALRYRTERDEPWEFRSEPGRISPRECVRNARDDMTKAWGRVSARHALYDIRGAVDWLRRALEQMAPPDPDALDQQHLPTEDSDGNR